MSETPDKSQRLRKVLEQCRLRLQEGKKLEDSAVIQRFPDLLPELAAELKKLRLVHNARLLAGPSAASLAGDARTTPHGRPPLDQPPLPVAAPREPLKVRYFGDYEFLEELGRGGMGVVYKARQVSLNRLVAVKMLLSGAMAGEEEVKRFYSEAEAAGHLEHPHIVPIYEVGEHQGTHYFSMAYVRGRSLHELLRDGPLPAKKAAEYLAKVADAIAYAHEQGVLHRDIKPHNILIDEHDQPRVTDFGLAKRAGSASDMTATGQVLGTPSYMPPEQALADRERIGPRSDVYSLGATLYACITGRPPFQAEKAAHVIMMVIGQEPVAPRSLNALIDPDLNTVCLKCLDKDCERRYSTAFELTQDLKHYLAGEPIQARPIGSWDRLRKWRRRNPVIAALGATLAIVVCSIAVVGPLIAIQQATLRASAERLAREKGRLVDDKQDLIGQLTTEQKATAEQRDLADERRKDAETQRGEAERRLLEAQRNSLNLHMNLAASLRTTEPMRAERLLDDPDHCPVELRDISWRILREACRSSVFDARDYPFRVKDIAFRPTSDEVAIADEQQIRFFDTSGGKPDRVIRGQATIAFSPDGDWFTTIVNATDAAVFRTDTLEKVAQWRLASKPGNLGSIRLRWLASGRILVTHNNTVWIDIPGTELRYPIRGKAVSGVAHGGNRFAFSTHEREVFVFEDDATLKQFRSRRFDSAVHGLAVSSDGAIVAVAQGADQDHPNDDRQLQLWDLDRDDVVHLAHSTDLQASQITKLSFSADGRILYAGSNASLITAWEVNTRRNVGQLSLGMGQLRELCANPQNGAMFAAVGKVGSQFGVWRIPPAEYPRLTLSIGDNRLNVNQATGSLVGLDLGHRPALRPLDDLTSATFLDPGGATAIDISADGSTLAAAYNDGKLRLFDKDQKLLKELGPISSTRPQSEGRNDIFQVSLSGDGRYLAAGRHRETKINIFEGSEQICTFDRTGLGLRRFAYSPTRPWLAIPEEGRTTVFNVEKKLIVCRIANIGESEFVACWSADGNLLVTASQGALTATDFVDDQPHRRFRVPGHKSAVQFLNISPDGKLIASGDIEGVLRFTDAFTGAERLVVPRANGGLLDGCFIDGGKDFVTTGLDQRWTRWFQPVSAITRQFPAWDAASVKDDNIQFALKTRGFDVGDRAARLCVLTYLSAQNSASARVFKLARELQDKRRKDITWRLCHYPDHAMPQAYEAACLAESILDKDGPAAFLSYWENTLKSDGLDADTITHEAAQRKVDLKQVVSSYKDHILRSKQNAQLYIARGELSPPIAVLLDRSTGKRFVIKQSILKDISLKEFESVVDGMLSLGSASAAPIFDVRPAPKRNSVGIEMTLVPPGVFRRHMVDDATETKPKPRGRGFYVANKEVTRSQFHAVMHGAAGYANEAPSKEDAELPAVNLLWRQAVDFCNRLSGKEGLSEYYAVEGDIVTIRGGNGYRLLDAEEWDYAAAAGDEPALVALGEKRSAFTWHKGNSENKTHRSAEQQPNEFGLYDTYGNVWEWCWPEGHFRGDSVEGELSWMIARGFTNQPDYRAADVGFRVARNVVFGPADRRPSPPETGPMEAGDDKAWFDVLALADPEEHTIKGGWRRSGDSLTAFADQTSVLELPVNVRGGYEFEWEFTRLTGDQDVNLIFPVDWRSCNLLLSGDHGRASGLDHVDFRGFADNSTTVKPGALQNGRRYRIRLRVELEENHLARVVVFQDGKQIIEWAGSSHRLGAPLGWGGSRPGRMLFAVMSDVEIHSAKLKQLGAETSQTVRHLDDLGEYRLSELRGSIGGGLLWGDRAPKMNQILIGLRIRHDDRIRRIVPIYRDAEGKETDGANLIGPTTSAKSTDVIARPGYAVGGIEVRSGVEVDGMRVIFMKMENGKLNPTDRYRSAWLGGTGGGLVPPVLSDGKPVVGLYGGSGGGALTSLGLVFADQVAIP